MEVVNGEEMENERAAKVEESEPAIDDDEDDEIEIDFESYVHMNESVLNEPNFVYVFKNEPEVVSNVEPVLPISVDVLEKFVVSVSADGVITFEKKKKETVERPGENNTEQSENEECAVHFEAETEEAEENTLEEESNPSSKTLIHSKESAKEESVKPVETSPNNYSDKMLGRRTKTTSENDKLSHSTIILTRGRQRTKIISAKDVEHCSNEFDEKLARRAVVVLEKCVVLPSSGTPTKICETNRVPRSSEKLFPSKTNRACQRKVARKVENKSGLSNSAVEGRNLRRIKRNANERVKESSPFNDKRRKVQRREKRDERGSVQRKPIAIERLRKPRAYLSSSGALNCKIAVSSSIRRSAEQFTLETGRISRKEVTPEKQTPEKLELRNLRRVKRNEMAKRHQNFSLSVRGAVKRLRQRPSSFVAAKNNSEIDDEKVEREQHSSPGNAEGDQEKLRTEARYLRRSRRKETTQQLEERSQSDNEKQTAQTKPRGVENERKPCTFLFLTGSAKNAQTKPRKPCTFLFLSRTSKMDECEIASSFSLQQDDEYLSPETDSESQKKLPTEVRNLRRSRRNKTAQQCDESSSSDENEKQIVTRLRKPRTLPSSPGTAKNQRKVNEENNPSLVIQCEKLFLPEIINENQEELSPEVRNLRRSRRNETAQQVEKISSSVDKEKFGLKKSIAIKRSSGVRTLFSSSGDSKKNDCNISNSFSLQRGDKHFSPEIGRGSQKKLRVEAGNLRRSRRNETAQIHEECCSSVDEGKISPRRASSITLRRIPISSRAATKNCKVDDVNDEDKCEAHLSHEISKESQEKITATPKKFELTAEAKSLSQTCRQLEVRCLSNVGRIIARRREDSVEERRKNKAKEMPDKYLQANEERRKTKRCNETTQEQAERRTARRSTNRMWKERETTVEHVSPGRCVASETPEQFQHLNRDDDNFDDECCSLEDEGKIAERSAKVVQMEPCATSSSSEVLTKNNNCKIDDEADNEDENSSSLAVECEEHFSPGISKENPEKLQKHEISLRNLKIFRTVNDTSKLEECYSADGEGKIIENILHSNHNNNCEIDDGNSTCISLEVECESHFLSSETCQENQEKEPTINDMFELSVSDDARRECSSDDEYYPRNADYYSSDDEYCTSDEEVKRRRKPRALLSVAETLAKILNEHSYSLEKCVVHFPPEAESAQREEVIETPDQFEERCVSVGAEAIAEKPTSPRALPAVSETPTKSIRKIDEEHCYNLDKCKTYATPESTEIESLQMITKTIEQRENNCAIMLDEARISRMRRAKETSEQRAKRYRKLLATETPEDRERRLARKRVADRRRMKNETPEEREKRLVRKRAADRRRRRKNETPDPREKRRLLDNLRGRIKRATETPEEREKRRAYYRERYKKYYYRNREASIEAKRAQKANETPEQREKRGAIEKASREKANERRAELRANNVKQVERKARALASKLIINDGKRRREELALQRASEISQIVQRRAEKQCDSPSFEQYEEDFLAGRKNQETPTKNYCRIVEEHCYSIDIRKIYATPESTEIETVPMIMETVERRENDAFSDEARMKRAKETPEDLAAQTRRENSSTVTNAPEKCRVKANGRDRRQICNIKSNKRLVECDSSDGDERRSARRRANAKRIIRRRIANEAERMRKEPIANETPEEQEKRLAEETLTFRNFIDKSFTLKDEERSKEVGEETIEEIEKLETQEEVEESSVFTELIKNNPPSFAQDQVMQAEEGEKSLPSKDLVVRIDDRLETPEELEARLAAESLAFRESIRKYSTYFAPDGIMREQCEKGLADKNVEERTAKEVETPEEMEAHRAADRLAFRELMGKCLANKRRKELEARVAAETLAFQKWREKNPLTELQFYVFKHLTIRNGTAGLRTREIETAEKCPADKAECFPRRKANEAPEKREKRLPAIRKSRAERKRWRIANETPEERVKRLERKKSHRAKETAEQREKRLKTKSRYKKMCYANEKPEEREKRLQYNRALYRKQREGEHEKLILIQARAERWRKRVANETPEEREKRLEAERQRRKRMKETETPEQRARRRENYSRRHRGTKNAVSFLQQQQGESNEPPPPLDSNKPNTPGEDGSTDKVIVETLDSGCSGSLGNADADGALSICLNSCDADSEVGTETLFNTNNCSNAFTAVISDDHIYTFSKGLNIGDVTNEDETLADSNCGDVVNEDQAQALVNSHGFLKTDDDALSNTSEDGAETLESLSSNVVADDEVIYALSSVSNDEAQAVAADEGTVPNTFYITNEDGTSSEIVVVYIDGVATS